jgi:hypothetical protein
MRIYDKAVEMSKENETIDERTGTLFDNIEPQSGGGVLGDITAVLPEADPSVLRMQRAEAATIPDNGSGKHSATENGGKRAVEVDPKAYTYVQDHKGNPFDPEKHQVDAEGNPIFNARGRVKCLEPGQENPIKLIFNNLKNMLLPEAERPQAECAAQASVQGVEIERAQAAEIMVDLYGGAGYVMRGAPFRKNWEKYRRQKLVNALIQYQRIKNITIPVKAEWILIHAFGTDLLSVEGENMFENKGGLLGFIGRKGWNIRARTLATEAEAIARKEQGQGAA